MRDIFDHIKPYRGICVAIMKRVERNSKMKNINYDNYLKGLTKKMLEYLKEAEELENI